MKLNIQLFADGSIEIEVAMETRSLEQQIAELEYDLDALHKAMNDPKATPKQLKEYERDARKVEKALKDLKKQQNELNNSGSSGLGGILKKMTKWGLAIFSIRSAYMLVRQATNQLAQENEEIANKINAIRGSVANLLAPVVQVIVDLVYRLLSYLNVITKQFLGIDLFKKTAKSGKSAVGSAKQLRKTLAGFDEMNILNDNVSGSGGASGGSNASITPPDTSNFEIAVKNYKKMWNEILDIDRQSAKELFLNDDKTWGLMKLGAFDATQGIIFQFQGLIDFFGGFWKIIKGLADGNTQAIWDGIKQVFTGVGEGLRGLIQTITGVFGTIVGLGYGLGADIGNSLREIQTKIVNTFKNIRNLASSLGEDFRKYLIDKITSIPTKLANIPKKIDEIKNKIKSNFSQGFWKGIAQTFIDILNKAIDKINSKFSFTISDKTAKVLKAIGIKANAGKYQILSIPRIPKLAKGGIINQPGRGVPIGSALGGESGREGVIPLTDSQQMALLGEAIGRYITINANITNSMNGRIISRELQKIQNENNFAGNR